jgi:hypothetical protein
MAFESRRARSCLHLSKVTRNEQRIAFIGSAEHSADRNRPGRRGVVTVLRLGGCTTVRGNLDDFLAVPGDNELGLPMNAVKAIAPATMARDYVFPVTLPPGRA